MPVIYFDNAATSWPKPPAVSAAVREHLTEAGGNPGRSGHRMSVAAARIVEDAREALADLFNASDPSRVVFTHNATHALNLALYGLLRPGDHVVTTSVEHNSVSACVLLTRSRLQSISCSTVLRWSNTVSSDEEPRGKDEGCQRRHRREPWF